MIKEPEVQTDKYSYLQSKPHRSLVRMSIRTLKQIHSDVNLEDRVRTCITANTSCVADVSENWHEQSKEDECAR